MSYIPSVIAAIVIILVGIVLGGFVGGLIAASAGAVHGGRALARVGRGGVILLAIFMALQELGIATDIVTTAFAILFGAIALALALVVRSGQPRARRRDHARVVRAATARERADAIAREEQRSGPRPTAESAEDEREHAPQCAALHSGRRRPASRRDRVTAAGVAVNR